MTNDPYSAVDMTKFDIDMIVLTKHKNINTLIEQIKNDIIYRLPYGLTKEIFYNQLQLKLKFEDQYFSANTTAAITEKQRWEEFNDDCIAFAALDYVLTGNPIQLKHPLQYNGNFISYTDSAFKGFKPTLIDGIEIEVPKTF